MLKKNGGITLIALVITIIVLLILAGVSIAMLTGDNGLLSRTSTAAAKERIAGVKDVISTEAASLGAEWYEERYVKNTPSLAGRGAYIRSNLSTNISGKEDSCTVTVPTSGAITVLYEGVTAYGTLSDDGTLTWSWTAPSANNP